MTASAPERKLTTAATSLSKSSASKPAAGRAGEVTQPAYSTGSNSATFTTAESTKPRSPTARSTTARSTTARSTTARSTTARSSTPWPSTARSVKARSTTVTSTTPGSTTAGSTKARSTTTSTTHQPISSSEPKHTDKVELHEDHWFPPMHWLGFRKNSVKPPDKGSDVNEADDSTSKPEVLQQEENNEYYSWLPWNFKREEIKTTTSSYLSTGFVTKPSSWIPRWIPWNTEDADEDSAEDLPTEPVDHNPNAHTESPNRQWKLNNNMQRGKNTKLNSNEPYVNEEENGSWFWDVFGFSKASQSPSNEKDEKQKIQWHSSSSARAGLVTAGLKTTRTEKQTTTNMETSTHTVPTEKTQQVSRRSTTPSWIPWPVDPKWYQPKQSGATAVPTLHNEDQNQVEEKGLDVKPGLLNKITEAETTTHSESLKKHQSQVTENVIDRKIVLATTGTPKTSNEADCPLECPESAICTRVDLEYLCM